MKLYLNKDVLFKSKKTFSCVYHQGTGWYYPAKPDFWKTLQSYKGGREVNPTKIPPALSELIENKFLIQTKNAVESEILNLYPLRIPETVYYTDGKSTYVAVERKGAHEEIDFDVNTLTGIEAQIWNHCDGNKTIKEIIDLLGANEKLVFKAIKEWVSIENQILRILSKPVSEFKMAPPQLIHKASFLPKKPMRETSTEDVQRYHLKTIKDGIEQFDRIESTLSHLYRVPHPILNGQSYGQSLYKGLNELKEIKPGSRILEIGGGMGSISTEILKKLKEERLGADYIIYDLSGGLIRSQCELHKKEGINANHINGNGEALALKDSCIDIAFSNEVIGDFSTPELSKGEIQDFLFDHEIPMTEEFFHCYRNAPEKVRINFGAFLLIKELFRVLKPGGLAVVTEYGFQDKLPFRAKHLDHAEYSIQFAQMISVATAIGFNLWLTDAFDFLGFRSDVKLMTHFSYQAAYRILEHIDAYLPNITYTEDLFRKELGSRAEKFMGISYVETQKDPIKIVKVMVCRKPDIQDGSQHD
jgi:ubiquinone/menaquinone biosynthesis C-methylase UbiE